MKVEEYQAIMESAISKEIEAYDFYRGVADKTGDPALKEIFSKLAQEEKGHKNLLEGLLAAPVAFSFDETRDYKVSESVVMPNLSLSMKPSEAIALAMKKEEAAMNMYAGLAAACTDKNKGEVFLSLSRMEQEHKKKLEDLYVAMAFPEAW